MKKSYDVVQGKQKPNMDKTQWIKVGKAFEKEGVISSMVLDVLPIPNDQGEIWLRVFESKPKDNTPSMEDNPW